MLLVDVQPATSQLVQGTWVLDSVRYENSVGCLDCLKPSRATYELAGAYRRFSATLATESDEESMLRIWLDDGAVIERRTSAGHPVDVVIDVTGVKTMIVELQADFYQELVLLGDGQLQK